MDVRRLGRKAFHPFAVLVLLFSAFAAPSASLAGNWGLAAPLWLVLVAAFAVVTRRSASRPAVIGTAFLLAWGTALVCAFVGYLISINTSICGKNIQHDWLPGSAGIIVYLAIGSWAFRARYRPLWALPVAVIAAAAVGIALAAVLPGAPGDCET